MFYSDEDNNQGPGIDNDIIVDERRDHMEEIIEDYERDEDYGSNRNTVKEKEKEQLERENKIDEALEEKNEDGDADQSGSDSNEGQVFERGQSYGTKKKIGDDAKIIRKSRDKNEKEEKENGEKNNKFANSNQMREMSEHYEENEISRNIKKNV